LNVEVYRKSDRNGGRAVENDQDRDLRVFDLQERLVQFAVRTMNLVDALPKTPAGAHIADQVLRSGTAPALNYAEALAAESRKDFVHKIKICLKELRETSVSLKIIEAKPLIEQSEKLGPIAKECNELISIFVASVGTAKRNIMEGKK
jgi:four helix bundle protein